MFPFPREEDVINFELEKNKAYFHLIGLPMSIKSYNKEINTNLMPEAIRECSNKIYSSLFGNINKAFIIDHDDINFENPNLELLKEKIDKINKNYNKKNVFIFLGGNHLISYYTIKALKPDLILHFDAHPDVEQGELANYSFLRFLINEGFKVISIGLCNGSKEEFDFLKLKKIKFFTSLDFYSNKQDIMNYLKDRINKEEIKSIYITFDTDFLRNNLASYQPEPLGIELFDFLLFFKELIEKSRLAEKIVGFDLVEYDKTKDINDFSCLMNARLLIETIAIINEKLK
ncbi:MAG: arginase family protein [Nanoarchaeota archaeon]